MDPSQIRSFRTSAAIRRKVSTHIQNSTLPTARVLSLLPQSSASTTKTTSTANFAKGNSSTANQTPASVPASGKGFQSIKKQKRDSVEQAGTTEGQKEKEQETFTEKVQEYAELEISSQEPCLGDDRDDQDKVVFKEAEVTKTMFETQLEQILAPCPPESELRKRDVKASEKEDEMLSRITKDGPKESRTIKRRTPRRISKVRKSQCQKDVLWDLYKRYKGVIPEREKTISLAQSMGLSINQIYKWFWDTNKKVEQHTILASQIGSVHKVISGNDEFGGYSIKKNYLLQVDGKNGKGENLTPQEIKTALKINQDAQMKQFDFESIAHGLNLNLEHLAQEIVRLPSPKGTRQIVKQFDPNKGKIEIERSQPESQLLCATQVVKKVNKNIFKRFPNMSRDNKKRSKLISTQKQLNAIEDRPEKIDTRALQIKTTKSQASEEPVMMPNLAKQVRQMPSQTSINLSIISDILKQKPSEKALVQQTSLELPSPSPKLKGKEQQIETKKDSNISFKNFLQNANRPKKEMTTEMYMSILNSGGTGSAAGKLLLDKMQTGQTKLKQSDNILPSVGLDNLVQRFSGPFGVNSIAERKLELPEKDLANKERLLMNSSLFSSVSLGSNVSRLFSLI